MPKPEVMSPANEEEGSINVGQVDASALAILNQSEHAAMVATARRKENRRSIEEFSKEIQTYATFSERVALTMFYSLPRAGKIIVGPSVRFAECLVQCWRNNAVGTRVMDAARQTVTAQGVFIDYETNIRISTEVPRRITDKNGNRYNDDMIVTTANAASSIARRNAVCAGVPRALWTPAYEDAMVTAAGKAKSLSQQREEAMKILMALGITEWQIFNTVGAKGVQDLDVEAIVTLRTLYREVTKGDKNIEDIFGSEFDQEIESLFNQLKFNGTQKRLHRDEYMGRAKDLVEYLRSRTGSAHSTTVDAKSTVVENGNASAPEGNKEKTGGGRKKKDQTTSQPANSEQAETKPAEPETQSSEKKPEPEERKQEPEKPKTEATPPADEVPQSGRFKF